jgi:Fic family protein
MPKNWMHYDKSSILNELANAKGAVFSLTSIPYQRRWVEALQEIQLKLEVAGTSKIEGADFAGDELDVALRQKPRRELLTRSQRQAHAAVRAYRWIVTIPNDHPINEDLICEMHRQIVTGADDDHCPAGKIRERDQNVTFGTPRHRGAEGGEECKKAFSELVRATQKEFVMHDQLIQALALHYHFGAMHPFLDGNGRTARVLEALMLGRAGLRDTAFIAMSNYYYDEKKAYLASLSEVRALGHDLTSFLKFGLQGIALQCERLAKEIRRNISKELFRSLMHDLFTRLISPRKRVVATRQLAVLEFLLKEDEVEFEELVLQMSNTYRRVRSPRKALVRDVNHLSAIGAVEVLKDEDERYSVNIRLEWPSEITESEFFKRVKRLPKAKTHLFLAAS